MPRILPKFTEGETRLETDSMGEVKVSKEALWGAQTQRALEHFDIGDDYFPPVFIKAYALLKRAAVQVNADLGKVDRTIADAIAQAADEVIEGGRSEHFPLSVWQTGSGTQTNMNMKEVLANRAVEIMGGMRGDKEDSVVGLLSVLQQCASC